MVEVTPFAARPPTLAQTAGFVPTVYVNGFIANCSITDFSVVGTLNDAPQIVLVMTHSAAKSLANNILATINQLRSDTGIEVEDFKEIADKIVSHQASNTP